jgi:hypothetical protein
MYLLFANHIKRFHAITSHTDFILIRSGNESLRIVTLLIS